MQFLCWRFDHTHIAPIPSEWQNITEYLLTIIRNAWKIIMATMTATKRCEVLSSKNFVATFGVRKTIFRITYLSKMQERDKFYWQNGTRKLYIHILLVAAIYSTFCYITTCRYVEIIITEWNASTHQPYTICPFGYFFFSFFRVKKQHFF